MIQRLTAYKVRIKDLLNNPYVIQQGEFEPNYIDFNGKKISRVNVIANVLDKQDTELLSAATIDDGTGLISVKCFNENVRRLRDIQVGDLVLVIGKVRKDQNDQFFIVGEIAKKLDNQIWAHIRREELEREYGKVDEKINQENIVSDKGRLLQMIRNLDKGEGVNMLELIKIAGLKEEEFDNLVRQLLEEGDAYESRPNILRSIE